MSTPDGVILVMGEPRVVRRSLIVSGVHMHGVGVGPNGVGLTKLRADRRRAAAGDGLR